MEKRTLQDQHTAGPQAIGFDYQFYLFMLLVLELNQSGQKIGFEVKDDIHIDKADGTTILLQAKHTIQKNADGSTQNLATLDNDLWKTLNNWANFIKKAKTNPNFLNTHSFILVTNKKGGSNDFIDIVSQFKIDGDANKVMTFLVELKDKTQDRTLEKYIKNVISLGKKNLKSFLTKLTLETNTDDVIKRIECKILGRVMQDKFVKPIFDSLYSNLQSAKYLEIKDQKKFEISFDDFKSRFGGCFRVAFEERVLPKRNFPILLPEDLESQIFIQQLLDIGEIQSGSKRIKEYTTDMLVFLRHFTYWSDEENFILLTDAEEFKKNSVRIWINAFRQKYREIERQVDSGVPITDLEGDIKKLGIELVEFIREQDLSIQGFSDLGVEFSIGHYYALSDNLEIGWHFDWENKYKKK